MSVIIPLRHPDVSSDASRVRDMGRCLVVNADSRVKVRDRGNPGCAGAGNAVASLARNSSRL